MATLRAKQYPYFTVYKYDISYTDLNTVAGLTSQKLLFYFPQRNNIAFAKLVTTTRWRGGAISSCRLIGRAGWSGAPLGGTSALIFDFNAFNPVVTGAGAWKMFDQLSGTIGGVSQGYAGLQSAANEFWIQAVTIGGNTTALNQGAATLWVGTIPTF